MTFSPGTFDKIIFLFFRLNPESSIQILNGNSMSIVRYTSAFYPGLTLDIPPEVGASAFGEFVP